MGQTNGGGRSAEASADLSINQIINKEDISMKKTYETPEVEVVKFQYRDQVVVASGKCVVSGEYSHYKGECGAGDASTTYNN